MLHHQVHAVEEKQEVHHPMKLTIGNHMHVMLNDVPIYFLP